MSDLEVPVLHRKEVLRPVDAERKHVALVAPLELLRVGLDSIRTIGFNQVHVYKHLRVLAVYILRDQKSLVPGASVHESTTYFSSHAPLIHHNHSTSFGIENTFSKSICLESSLELLLWRQGQNGAVV
jgi:hypothetical protein